MKPDWYFRLQYASLFHAISQLLGSIAGIWSINKYWSAIDAFLGDELYDAPIDMLIASKIIGIDDDNSPVLVHM